MPKIKQTLSKSLTLMIFSVMVVSFQNCSSGFETINDVGTANGLSTAPPDMPTVDGKALYTTNCAACHNALLSSTKIGRSATQIQNAILTVPLMMASPTLKTLSVDQVNAIVVALKDNTPTDPTQQTSALMNRACVNPANLAARDSIRLNRFQYINILKDIFGQAAVDALVTPLAQYRNDMNIENTSEFVKKFNQLQIDTFFEISQALGKYVAGSSAAQEKIGAGCLSGVSGIQGGLVKAINVNGAPATIDGLTYTSEAQSGLTFSGTINGAYMENATLSPAVDFTKGAMIRSFRWGQGGMNAQLPITNGNYQVYAYSWEDNLAASITLSFENKVVETFAIPVGQWRKLGPYNVTVSDGALNLSATGGDFMLSGLEIYNLSSGGVTLSESDCLKQFINEIGLKTLRRPLNTTEAAALKAIADAGGSREQKLGGVIEALLQSPNFLYQTETGTSMSGDIVNFSAYEIASKLSFQIWDTIPDKTLFDLAASGELLKPAVQQAQVNRMFNDEKARAKVGRLAMYWTGQYSSTHAMRNFPTTPPAFVNGINSPVLANEVLREMQEFVQYQVFDKRGTYQDLLLSTDSFARTDDLAKIYGHSKVSDSMPAMMSSGRKGLLMRPILLSNSNSSSSPIVRGARLRSRFFCAPLGAPPVGAESEGLDLGSRENIIKYSNRERVTLKTAGGSCFGCHSQANPIGFAFEKFDAFGRARTIEVAYDTDGSEIATHSINSNATVTTSWGEKWDVLGAEDFVEKIATSQTGPACFSRHAYEFYQMQPDSEADNCLALNIIEKSKNSSQGIIEALKAVVLSNYLTRKKIN